MHITAATIIGFLLSFAGLALLAGSVYAYDVQRQTEKQRTFADGEVIALVRRRVKVGGRTVVCPVVRFRTTSGQEFQFESVFGTMPASHEVGQPIPVRYDPADPRQAEIATALSQWAAPVAVGSMGFMVLCMGFFLLLPSLL